jgi:hypothetical protein
MNVVIRKRVESNFTIGEVYTIGERVSKTKTHNQ